MRSVSPQSIPDNIHGVLDSLSGGYELLPRYSLTETRGELNFGCDGRSKVVLFIVSLRFDFDLNYRALVLGSL